MWQIGHIRCPVQHNGSKPTIATAYLALPYGEERDLLAVRAYQDRFFTLVKLEISCKIDDTRQQQLSCSLITL